MDNRCPEDALYDVLRNQIAVMTEEIKERRPDQIMCRKGCDSCCRTKLFLLPVEFDVLKKGFSKLPGTLKKRIRDVAQDRWNQGYCPLLLDGACALYESRPVVCRTHGFPLYSQVSRDSESRVMVCALNFNGAAVIEDQDLIDMDTVGMMLVGSNQEYMKTIQCSEPPSETRPILDVIR